MICGKDNQAPIPFSGNNGMIKRSKQHSKDHILSKLKQYNQVEWHASLASHFQYVHSAGLSLLHLMTKLYTTYEQQNEFLKCLFLFSIFSKSLLSVFTLKWFACRFGFSIVCLRLGNSKKKRIVSLPAGLSIVH